ncbi:hypothetical protein [Rubrolithibacter danxiaensis]|uniref:hypothetical protein n=1 Tax=Rubrolithibacter danxiaensis TaxID=3390805 RepID=UPI003BF8EF19
MRSVICIGFLLISSLAFYSCNSSEGSANTRGIKKPSFQSIKGIRFTEVRRSFENGLAFNEIGFQQEPEWVMEFLSDDSVKVYSPERKRFFHFPVTFSHDSVFNFAGEWFRFKQLGQDSLLLQLLKVESRVVSKEMSNVLMKFYSDAYINKVFHGNLDSLRKPKKRDTLFIRSLAEKANRNPGNIDSAFAARNPVVLKSKSPVIEVKKLQVEKDPLNNISLSDAYIHPTFYITINKAYKDFNHSFLVLVDNKGIMHYGKPLEFIMPEFEESKKRVSKGIMEVYLQNLLEITPGNTLGLPHTSLVSLHVIGKSR